METITEDYVSFEAAKLLKEKGFSELTAKAYPYFEDKNYKYDISCPTLQMAMKWLREVHHLYIQVMFDSWACGGHTGYYVVIQNTTSDFEMMLQDALDIVFYDTYEQACEEACIYALKNLI